MWDGDILSTEPIGRVERSKKELKIPYCCMHELANVLLSELLVGRVEVSI